MVISTLDCPEGGVRHTLRVSEPRYVLGDVAKKAGSVKAWTCPHLSQQSLYYADAVFSFSFMENINRFVPTWAHPTTGGAAKMASI